MKQRLIELVISTLVWTVVFLWNLGWFVTKTVLQFWWWIATQAWNIENKPNPYIPWWEKEVDPTRKG